jgi:hypothetical protein
LAEVQGIETTSRRERRRTAAGVEAYLGLNVPISEADLGRVWDVAVGAYGLGDIETQGHTKVWRARSGTDPIEVGVRRGDASTDVWLRVEDRFRPRIGWLLGVVGLGFAAGLRHPLGLFVLAAVAWGGWLGYRAWRRREMVRRLERQLDAIEAELTRSSV